MKRFLILTYILIAALTTHAQLTSSPLDQEIRAVWLTTIGGIDWPRTYATSPANIERQKQELVRMLENEGHQKTQELSLDQKRKKPAWE